MAVSMNMNANMKADAASKEIEEAMKRVREARSLIAAAIEPGSKWMERKKWCHCGDVLLKKVVFTAQCLIHPVQFSVHLLCFNTWLYR